MKRTIIKIDETLCNGCGACVSGCHEGALQMINEKAVMVSELYCDGLGACIGECPVGAITLEEREAEPYDENAVMERIAPKGESVIIAHLKHLKDHGEKGLLQQGFDYLKKHDILINFPMEENKQHKNSLLMQKKPGMKHDTPPLACGCPGSMMRDLRRPEASEQIAPMAQTSELRQFPVQLHLLNPQAPFLQGANLLLAADCTAFAAGNFHSRFLKGKMLAIACPKLDSNIQTYIDKLADMIDIAGIDTLTVLIMEVPCCSGLVKIAEEARRQAERNIPVKVIVLSVRDEVISEQWV